MDNLLSIETKIKQTQEKTDSIVKEYDQILHEQDYKLANLKHQKEILMNGFDVNKINNAKRFIYTRGVRKNFEGDAPFTLYKAKEDVVNSFKTLKTRYFGCKNYEGFIGQGVTCEYGMCPTYGYITFEIGLTNKFRRKEIEPTEDDICDILYFLNLLKDEKTRVIVLKDEE